MASKVQQWLAWLVESWRDAFPPIDAEPVDRANWGMADYYGAMEGLSTPQKEDMWKRMAGEESGAEQLERDKEWVQTTIDSIARDGAPQYMLDALEKIKEAKWPVNMIGLFVSWFAWEMTRLGGVAKVLGSEAMFDVARELRPARPDEGMAWKMAFTDKGMRPKVIEALKDRGWSDDLITAMEKAAREYTDAGAAMALYRRGELDQAGFFDRLAVLGFDADSMVDLEKLKALIPGPTDLVRMGLREAWDDRVSAQWGYDADFPEDFAVWMEKQGYSRDWSEKYWRAHWVLPSVSNGFEMYHRGIITKAELEELLRISDIPSKWRDNLVKVAYKPYTRVDVRRMHDMGILNDAELKKAYMDLGYDDEKAEGMTAFTIAYNDRTGDSEMTEYKALTRSVIVSAYQKGIISQDQAETRLIDIGYDMDGIDLILSLAAWQKDIDDIPDPMPEYRRDLKGMIEKAYSQRILSASEATDILVGVGFTEMEVTYMLSAVDLWYSLDQSAETLKTIGQAYVSRGMNRADAISALGQFGLPSAMTEQKLAEWTIQRNIRPRRATEAQYRKALELEVIGRDEYQENLKGLGYTDYDIWMFTAMIVGVEAAGEPSETGPVTLMER